MAKIRWLIHFIGYRWIVYIYRLSIEPFVMLRGDAKPPSLRYWITKIGEKLLYLFVGFPFTACILLEIAIGINRVMTDGPERYVNASDFKLNNKQVLHSPGVQYPKTNAPNPASKNFHQQLVAYFSPVIWQEVSRMPQWDLPVFIDYDGNDDPRDNVANEKAFRPLVNGIYGELTAETKDAYYFTYSIYHIKDYDHPIREYIFPSSFHDNDHEGFHVLVNKKTMKIHAIETWYHNRYLVFNHTGVSNGSEPIYGKIHVENDSHPIIYVHPLGHGVRCAQTFDAKHLKDSVKIFRLSATNTERARVDRSSEYNLRYQLDSYDKWYRDARGPFYDDHYFVKSMQVGPDENMVLGNYIAVSEGDKAVFVRPKPPWAWVDIFSNLPPAIWHFYPSYSFAKHLGEDWSHHYLYNKPITAIYAKEPNQFLANFYPIPKYLETTSMEGLDREDKVLHHNYWKAAGQFLKEYINHVAEELG